MNNSFFARSVFCTVGDFRCAYMVALVSVTSVRVILYSTKVMAMRIPPNMKPLIEDKVEEFPDR
jgi:hypothetical protein